MKTGDVNKKHIELSANELIMSFEGKELSEDYNIARSNHDKIVITEMNWSLYDPDVA